MNITIEQVERIKNRMAVTYKEAKEALERTDGNELEAMILLEGSGHSKQGTRSTAKAGFEKFSQGAVDVFKQLHAINFCMTKEGKLIFGLPLTVILVLSLFMMPILMIGLVVGWATGYQFEVKGPSRKENVVVEEVQNHDSK